MAQNDQYHSKDQLITTHQASPGIPRRDTSNNSERNEMNDSVPWYRRKRVLIPVGILILLIIAGVWYWYANLRGFDTTDDAYIDADRVAVSSKVVGRIEDLNTDEGFYVTRGQVLATLDATDLRAQEAQASANLVYAQQNVRLAKVNQEKAQDDFNRAEIQIKQNVIPKEQFDHTRKALDAAEAQYSIAQAQVGTAGAQLDVVRTQLQNTIIASPMNGVVAKRWVLPGDVVQPGQPIFSVYDLQNIWIIANFEETKIASLHLGDPAEISVDAYPNLNLHGKVIRLGTNTLAQFSLIPPNNASGNFTKVTQRVPVRISIENFQQPTTQSDSIDSDDRLLPGMSVEVKVSEQ